MKPFLLLWTPFQQQRVMRPARRCGHCRSLADFRFSIKDECYTYDHGPDAKIQQAASAAAPSSTWSSTTSLFAVTSCQDAIDAKMQQAAPAAAPSSTWSSTTSLFAVTSCGLLAGMLVLAVKSSDGDTVNTYTGTQQAGETLPTREPTP